MSTSSYFFPTFSLDDDDQDQLKKLLSPSSAQSLVATPPDSAPKADTSQSTPRTGNLALPPQQATPTWRGPAVDQTNVNGGNASSISPTGQPSLSQQYSQLTASRPAQPGAGSDSRTVTVRDLSGTPVTSGPRDAVTATRPAIAATLASRAGASNPAQAPVPYSPLMQQRQPASGLQVTQPAAGSQPQANSTADPRLIFRNGTGPSISYRPLMRRPTFSDGTPNPGFNPSGIQPGLGQQRVAGQVLGNQLPDGTALENPAQPQPPDRQQAWNRLLRNDNNPNVAPISAAQSGRQTGLVPLLAARMGYSWPSQQPAGAQTSPGNLPAAGAAGRYAQMRQAYDAQQRQNANSAAPSMPASLSGPGPMPMLPNTASPVAPQNQQRLAQDQSRLNYLTNSGSGVSQIKNPVGRGFARAGDIALSVLASGVAPLVPGTTAHNQYLVNRQQGVVGNDEDQIQKAAQAADTQSQIDERNAQGRRYDAQANLYNPEPMSAGQAQTLGHPEWEGLKLDARDAERLIGGAAHNDTTLQTHFGGQQKTLSQDEAAAIRMPSLAGHSMSNDEYQRTLQQLQRNTQSDTNNTRTNDTRVATTGMNDRNRITTTGMRDSTSTANSERAHPNAGTAKPIPAAIRDRIESQKNLALNKARTSFDQGETTQDEYLDNWQAAQNDYEDRLSAQTGGPIPHTDIRSNVDSKGNWVRQPAPQRQGQPQAQPAGNSGGFVTHKGSRVAVGDPITVNGKKGIVMGFNQQTGKAQVSWQVAR